MATVTGKLADFALGPLAGLAPRIVFKPSGWAVGGVTTPYLLATQEKTANLDLVTGDWTATLVHTDILRPARWYEPRVEWLDAAGNITRVDYIDVKLFVPASGGNIVDLLNTAWNPVLAWYGPSFPPGDGVPNTLALNTITGELFIRSN